MAQTGGGFDLSHNVIAGGGERSTGGSFTLEGTIGQANAGNVSTDATLSLRSGFWEFGSFAPTAAGVSLGGRVMSANGYPIGRARITLNNAGGMIRHSITNPFGYYRFEDVPAGDTYLISVGHKIYQFGEPVRVVVANADDSDITFIALPN